MGAMGSYSPSHGSIGIPSSRCNSYSHGSIGNQQSRCTSYHHGSLGIPQSRCTSYHHGSIGIHSYGCTSYVSGSPFLVTMPSAGSSMGPPAVAVPQIKYAARPGEGRLLDYASSLRLVSMSAPRFWGGPYGTTTASSAAASSGGPTNLGGPISVPAWDQFSTASSSGLSPQEYAALNRMPMGSSEPVREWPKFLRVRVSGDLNYTKVLTGNAAERSAGCVPLGYRPAPEVEAVPGPTVVGEKYLLVCERSLQLEREWAEAKLIMEGRSHFGSSFELRVFQFCLPIFGRRGDSSVEGGGRAMERARPTWVADPNREGSSSDSASSQSIISRHVHRLELRVLKLEQQVAHLQKPRRASCCQGLWLFLVNNEQACD